MSEEQKEHESLRDELRDLGENLVETLRSAWESPERKQLQKEIEEGLASLAETVKKESETFKESPTGQRMKSDFEDLRQRVDSGEVELKVRQELLKALQFINTELRKFSGRQPEDTAAGEVSGSPEAKE